MTAADTAHALGDARREGRGWRCRCPLHNGIETAITNNAPPFNQPWPPTGLGDGWHLVRSYPDCKQTLWRRVRLRTRAEVTRRA